MLKAVAKINDEYFQVNLEDTASQELHQSLVKLAGLWDGVPPSKSYQGFYKHIGLISRYGIEIELQNLFTKYFSKGEFIVTEGY